MRKLVPGCLRDGSQEPGFRLGFPTPDLTLRDLTGLGGRLASKHKLQSRIILIYSAPRNDKRNLMFQFDGWLPR